VKLNPQLFTETVDKDLSLLQFYNQYFILKIFIYVQEIQNMAQNKIEDV
jgi:hypothetical protein